MNIRIRQLQNSKWVAETTIFSYNPFTKFSKWVGICSDASLARVGSPYYLTYAVKDSEEHALYAKKQFLSMNGI